MAIDESQKRTPGLFKEEFRGTRVIALTSKCYFADSHTEKKVSCKGVNKRQNEMIWQRYYEALFEDNKDCAKNRGFRIDKGHMVTYDQSKLGLSAYYDKRKVLDDKDHTEPLF